MYAGVYLSCTFDLPLASFENSKRWQGTRYERYLIKGIALDAYEYGRKIKLVEDLAGNFPKNIDTFTAFGNKGFRPISLGGVHFGRLDYLVCNNCYNKGDVLIMLLVRAFGLEEYKAGLNGTPESIEEHLKRLEEVEGPWMETSEDFMTLGCVFSVLSLINDHVYVPGRGFAYRSWNDFQKELNNILQKTD